MFVDVLSHEQHCLFLQIVRFVGKSFLFVFPCQLLLEFRSLFLNLLCRLLRCRHAPHLIERVHVERQVIQLSLVVCHGGIGIAIEWHDGVHEIPHLFVGGMEYVGTVFMHVYSLDTFAIYVSSQMASLVYHQATFAFLCRQMGKCGSEQSRSYDQIIIMFHVLSSILCSFFSIGIRRLSAVASCSPDSFSISLCI